MNRKRAHEKEEEDILQKAMSVLNDEEGEKKIVDADILFGESVGASLKSITDIRSKEYIKVKIQELVFQAQFGLLAPPTFPVQAPYYSSVANTSSQLHLQPTYHA